MKTISLNLYAISYYCNTNYECTTDTIAFISETDNFCYCVPIN